MNKIAALIENAVAGAMLGAAALVILLTAAVGLAYGNGHEVLIPGVFRAWFTQENGLPALNFDPNAAGMLVLVAVTCLLHTAAALTHGMRRVPCAGS